MSIQSKAFNSRRVIPIRAARENLAKWNRRVGQKLDQEQYALAKKLRKPRNSDAFAALEALYDYVDRVYAHADTLVACRKGCAWCCHIPVHVTMLEIQHIAAKTGAPLDQHLVHSDLASTPTNSDPLYPCPFLRNNECSIYEHRPMSCRTHVNFEPTDELCRFDAPKGEQVLLVDRAKSFPAIFQTFFALGAPNVRQLCELRDYFRSGIPKTT